MLWFISALVLPTLVISQSLVLLGGNLRDGNVPVWTTIIDEAGGPGVANIGVFSASTVGSAKALQIVDNLVKIYHAKDAFLILLTKLNADDPEVVNQLTGNCTGVLLIDDPEERNIVDFLRPSGVDTSLLIAMKTIINNGGMVAGNSAIMGTGVMIRDGDSMNALIKGTKFENTFSGARVPLIFHESGGLGLIKDYVLESHLSEKGRELRLIRTLLDTKMLPSIGTTKGLGVDENTALLIKNPFTKPVGKVITDTFSVSGVFLVDVANFPDKSDSVAMLENAPFSFITVNDTVDLVTGEVNYVSWKIPIAGEEWFEDAIPSADIFSMNQPAQWRQTNRRLIDCKETNVTCFTSSAVFPQAQVFFDRRLAVGFGADIPNDPDKTYVASFSNMLMSIKFSDN